MKTSTLLTHALVLFLGLGLGYLLFSNPSTPKSSDKTEVKKDTEADDNQVASTDNTSTGENTNAGSPQEEGTDDASGGTETAGNERGSVPEAIPSSPVNEVNRLPASDQCFGDEEQFSYQLSLFSEEVEKRKYWYSNSDPDDFLNNSGIFHRAAEFVRSKCDRYDYPPKSLRGSVNIAEWYAGRKVLNVVKSREDALIQRDKIHPGTVMFFGRSGQLYNDMNEQKVLAQGANLVINHIGIVTEVKKGSDGRVEGYVMLHGRGDGKYAQRTHYHSVNPAGFGMPPLGNYNQQWIAFADIRVTQTEIQPIVAQRDEEVDIPNFFEDVNANTMVNAPGNSSMACFGFDFDEFFYKDVALALEAQKIGYNVGPRSDCSGIVSRVCEKVSEKLGDGCAGTFMVPCEEGYKNSRALAKWYYDNKNLQIVTKPQKMGDLIKVGAVMFYGYSGNKYDKKMTIEELATTGVGIQHVGVVVDVERNDKGEVVNYHLFHGHGRTGTPADITRPSKGKNQYTRNDRKAFSYWDQQWVAIAPSILTLNAGGSLSQNN